MMPWRPASAAPATMAMARPTQGSISVPILKPDQGAKEHHPLDAEVDDPGTLGEQLSDGGQQQHRAGGDASRQRQLQVHWRTTRTR